MPRRGVMLFTRDLRIHDNPALAAATKECEQVVPLFVLDRRLQGSPNRNAFLRDALADLDHSLGHTLVVRGGKPSDAIAALGADVVYLSEDVSPYARRREAALRERFDVHACGGITVAPAGALAPKGSTHYSVFTPYWRAWRARRLPRAAEPELPLRVPGGLAGGVEPDFATAPTAQSLPAGGERAGVARLDAFDPHRYADERNDLAADRTSRLSPYLHFGCVSPREIARRAKQARAEDWLRELCWRDFFAQFLAAVPELLEESLREPRAPWRDDPDGLAAWKEGRTGYPVVDAAMRQLVVEGWIPNRARLVAASFLTKHLLVDWRLGAAHFLEHLVDGDAASNQGNWQWVAGTGIDTRPYRVFNPTLQGTRYDPTGAYVRRYVPELGGLPDSIVHDPPPLERAAAGYPQPIVEHRAAVARLRSGS